MAAVVAIMAPVMVGSMGLGAETGYWMLTDQKVQAAADVAAHAVGKRMAMGDNMQALQNLAEYVVGASDVDMNFTTVLLGTPPTQGAYMNNASAVEVTVTRSVPRMFSKMYAQDDLDISARAVAAGAPTGLGCILGLHPTDKEAVMITGSAHVELDGCEIISNSNEQMEAFEIKGNGSTTIADCIRVVGAAKLAYNPSLDCGSVVTNSAAIADPFADVPEPSRVGACHAKKQEDVVLTPSTNHPSGMMSMRFCDGLELKGNVTLNPGLYIVEGKYFKINSNAVINGTGVVFYVYEEKVSFNGSATINLSAPTSGTYEGLLIFQSRNEYNEVKINGNAGTSFNGAVYAPDGYIEISGNSETANNSCTHYIADWITVTGNGTIRMDCHNPYARAITIDSRVVVVE